MIGVGVYDCCVGLDGGLILFLRLGVLVLNSVVLIFTCVCNLMIVTALCGLWVVWFGVSGLWLVLAIGWDT